MKSSLRLDEDETVTKKDCSVINKIQTDGTNALNSRTSSEVSKSKRALNAFEKIRRKGRRRKLKNSDTINEVVNSDHECSPSPERLRSKNYGAIKITVKKSSIRRRSIISLGKIPSKKLSSLACNKIEISEESYDQISDPFAFVTIYDQVKFLTPQEACLKLPHEFSLVKKRISEFEAIWAHRTSEF